MLLWPAEAPAGGLPEDYADSALNSTERIELARAYVELLEGGLPGPDLRAIDPGLVVVPLQLLDSADKDIGSALRELRLRACVLVSRHHHFHTLASLTRYRNGERAKGEEALEKFAEECRGRAGKVRRNSPHFCLAAPVLSASAPLDKKTGKAVASRCPEGTALVAAIEKLSRQESFSRTAHADAMELALDLEGNWFERRYVEALLEEAGRRLRMSELATACKQEKDCVACRKVTRSLFQADRGEEGKDYVARMLEEAGGACAREAFTILAWRQDWQTLSDRGARLETPRPKWYLKLELYRVLLAIAAGEGDPVAAAKLIDEAYRDDQRHCLFSLVVQGLTRATRVFTGAQPPEETTKWILEQGSRKDVKLHRSCAFSVLMTLLSALAEESDKLAFIDSFLTGPAAGDCPTLHRASLELLFMAFDTHNTDRLMQSLVLLERAWESCRDMPALRHDLEAFRDVAAWADRSWAGDDGAALVALKNSSRALLARLSGSAPRVRSMVLLNLLASTVRSRQTIMPDMESFLDKVLVRKTPYYVAWLYYYLQKRKPFHAYAVARLCERVASDGLERGICTLWQAAIHDLAGRSNAADKALALARTEIGTDFERIQKNSATLVVQGDRRVRILLDQEGDIDVKTDFAPMAVLVLLPRRQEASRD